MASTPPTRHLPDSLVDLCTATDALSTSTTSATSSSAERKGVSANFASMASRMSLLSQTSSPLPGVSAFQFSSCHSMAGTSVVGTISRYHWGLSCKLMSFSSYLRNVVASMASTRSHIIDS